MQLIYNIIIAPLEYLMRLILENSYQLTGSFGVSILFVSLTVSIAILPLYLFADKLQDKERDIQRRMKSKIDEFKSVYKGYELHLYLSNTYKQYGYHPVYGLRSLLGLAIQIPFFIAAFHLLSNYSGMNGKAFIFFNDLAKPDGLLNIAGYSINIMPFVMTAFNLGAAFIYGKKISLKENIQLYFISLVFLVLLYASPSGLLFYWTCNNIFTFFKNIVHYMLSSRNNDVKSDETLGAKNSLNSIGSKAKTGLKYCSNLLFANYRIVLTAFIVIMLYLTIGYLPEIKKPTSLSKMLMNTAAIFVFLMNLYMIAVLSSVLKNKLSEGLFTLTKKKLTFFFFVFIALTVSYISAIFLSYGNSNYLIRLFLVISGLISIVICSMFISKSFGEAVNYRGKKTDNKAIPIAECVLFVFFFCFLNPLILFLPSAEDLGGQIGNFVFFAVKAVLFGVVILLFTLFVFRKKLIILTEIIVISIFVGIIFGYIYQKDFGIMRGLRFVNESPLAVNTVTVLIDILILTSIVVLVKKLYHKFRKEALACLVLIFAVQSVMFYIGNSGSSGEKVVNKDSEAVSDTSYLQKEKKLLADFSFSKDKDNIFIMFLDGFSGFLATDLINKYPDYTKEMTGFVFYRNTVSAGSYTFPSTPAMIGGHKSEMDKLNTDSDKSYGDKFNDIVLNHARFFNKNGFKAVYYDLPYFSNWKKINQEGGSVISRGDLSLFRKKHGEPYKTDFAKQAYEGGIDKLKKESFDEKILIKLSLFKVMPYLQKHQIYFKTDKILGNRIKFDESVYSGRYTITDSLWSSLPSVVNNTSNMPTIKWIYSSAMVRPYHINEFGGPPIEEIRKDMYDDGGYDEAFATANYEFEFLNKMIKRMKELKIYDNSTIILVSDHGVAYRSNWHDSAINPLLMIKERNARGDFKISYKLMSNADIYAITTYIASKKSDDIIDNPLLSNEKRTVKYFATKHGNPSDLKNNVMEIDFVREISDTIIGKYKWPEKYKKSFKTADNNLKK